MKTRIEVQYYQWSTTSEVHVYCSGSDHMVVRCADYNDVEWEIQHIDEDVNGRYIIQDLTVLSEEELFQLSTVWSAPLDLFLVHAIQEHVLENQPSLTVDLCYEETLEY